VKVGRVSKEDTMEIKNKLLQENRTAFDNVRIVFDGKIIFIVQRVFLKENILLS